MMNMRDTLIDQNFLRLNAEKKKAGKKLFPTRNEYMDGDNIMDEIMGRKRSRLEQSKINQATYFENRFGMTYSELLSYGLDSELSDLEWRRAIREGKIKGDFAGEDMSFPIATIDDVKRAWQSIGRTKQDRIKVMKNIIKIAKKYGWESGLPQTVKDRMKLGGSGLP
jgi:hypothetical protein